MKKSAVQELRKRQRRMGFADSDALFSDYSRNDGIEPHADYHTSLISGLLTALPTLSEAQKRVIYEQLIKSGFTP